MIANRSSVKSFRPKQELLAKVVAIAHVNITANSAETNSL
jgi:hypothetical protein